MVVFIDGVPAKGVLKIYDPWGNFFEREVEDGLVKFFFDSAGNWRLVFENHLKEVEVIKPRKTESKVLAKNISSPTAGFLVLSANSLAGFAFLFLILLAGTWVKFFRKTVRKTNPAKDR